MIFVVHERILMLKNADETYLSSVYKFKVSFLVLIHKSLDFVWSKKCFTCAVASQCIEVPMDTDLIADTIYSLQGYTEIQDTVYRGTNGYRLYSGYNIQFTGVYRDTGYSV